MFVDVKHDATDDMTQQHYNTDAHSMLRTPGCRPSPCVAERGLCCLGSVVLCSLLVAMTCGCTMTMILTHAVNSVVVSCSNVTWSLASWHESNMLVDGQHRNM